MGLLVLVLLWIIKERLVRLLVLLWLLGGDIHDIGVVLTQNTSIRCVNQLRLFSLNIVIDEAAVVLFLSL